MNYHNAEFVKSAANQNAFIKNDLPQIIFSGRSNVGKSSLINCLLNRKSFARVSSVPGKTSQINYMLIDHSAYFVDLPGYGYASVSKEEKVRWANLIERYFQSITDRDVLGLSLVDSRHKPTSQDQEMVQLYKEIDKPFYVIANKIDLVKKSEIEKAVAVITETLDIPKEQLILFSSKKGTGKSDVLKVIDDYVGK